MKTIRRIALCAALALVGCSHAMDGPTPTITKIVPSVACNQLDTSIVITGTGFVPVPEQTLQKMSVLLLPTVTLVDAGGVKTAVDTSAVTWTDETSMTFIVHASLGLQPGVYDVVVTNPTGKSATAHGALTMVPPPTLVSIKPTEICDMRTTQVTLTGTSFRDDPATAPLVVTVGTPTPTVLSEADGAVTFVDAQTVTVNIPPGLPDGVWSVTIQNADGCSSTLDNALTIAPPPTITSIAPTSAWNGQDTTITISGTGFRMTPAVTIAAAGGAAITLAVSFVDAQHVTAIVPKATPAGSYTLTLTNPDGCSATTALTVTNRAPVTVTGVVNPFGCSTKDTPITITGTFFESTPQAFLVAAATAGADLKLKNVAFVSSTKLTAIVPSGGVIGGAYTLEVVNPDGS
ncbi:MAG: IPT/TIG domain-containing protein, partial [Myxococcales bacterium]|nr:IPT/TIG domain-containing protein [Myxococcales bacterium]